MTVDGHASLIIPFPSSALSSTTITESSPSSAVESSCSEGTVLTGLNVFVGKQDPVALKDSEYPVWLWSLNEPIKKEFTEEEKLSKDYLKYLAEQRIKLNSMRRRMKK